MNKRMVVSGGGFLRRKFAGSAWRAGIAKDKLIFIVICSVALTIAAVTLTISFTSDKPLRTVEWQCISCNYEFASKSAEIPPIECPKCGGTGRLKLPPGEPGELDPITEELHRSRHSEH